MKILITGASGFIGTALSNAIKHHRLVMAVSNPASLVNVPSGAEVISYEGLNKDRLSDVDVMIHLAARVHQMKEAASDPVTEFRKANTDFTLKLAALAIESGVRKFIFASTVKVVGERKREMAPLAEDATLQPEDLYGISKMEAEKGLELLFGKQKKSSVFIIRLPMVYGPGNKGNMLTLLKMASKRIPLPLGGVNARRSMLYIGNLCDAVIRVAEDEDSLRPVAQTYFINDCIDISSKDLYSMIFREYSGKNGTFYVPAVILKLGGLVGGMIEKAIGIKLPLNREVTSRLMDAYRFSSDAFCRDYDWHPPFIPEEGIKETVQWHKKVGMEQNGKSIP